MIWKKKQVRTILLLFFKVIGMDSSEGTRFRTTTECRLFFLEQQVKDLHDLVRDLLQAIDEMQSRGRPHEHYVVESVQRTPKKPKTN